MLESSISKIKRKMFSFFKNQNKSDQSGLSSSHVNVDLQAKKSAIEQEEDIKNKIQEMIDQGEIKSAVEAISRAVLEFSSSNDFIGKHIYLPKLDELVEKISKKILSSSKKINNKMDCTKTGRPIIVSTELYFEGGHSRIAEELIKLHPSAIIILTNFFEGSSRTAEVATKAVKDLPILVLPSDTSINNIIRLNDLCKIFGSTIYHLGHHHDVVLNAAICNIIDIPVYFIHHSDHKPTLGNTIKSFIHVDIVKHIHSLCSLNFKEMPLYWPQGVYDFGVKKFHYPISEIVTASSGSHTKFSWSGEESYQNLIVKLLLNGVAIHYHIGSLESFQQELIVSQLQNNGIDLDRMRFIGPVESLWKILLDSPINCFIGSRLIHGLRTAIEVQGAGIPFFPFLQSIDLPFMFEKEHYNSEAIFWSNIDELCKQIQKIKLNHHSASTTARKFYELNFTIEHMKKAMQATSGVG